MGSEPDYRDLVEVIGDMIYTLDLEGRFTYVNSAGSALLGYERGELVGRHFREVLTEASREIASEHFARGIQGNETTPFFEVQAFRGDGTVVDLEIRAGSLYSDGTLIGRQGVARDITMLKDLQRQVAFKSQRLTLLEDQARIAMDLYRRIADLTLSAPADPEGTERALRSVEGTLARASAEKLGLNAEDVRVIELIAAGRSNREIGAQIHLSPNTVKDRVSKLMRALGARSRSEVVAQAARRGLVAS
jgi:PAS domain S-box-containing protein